MQESFISLASAVVGADGSSYHRSRRGRTRQPRSVREDMGNWIWIQNCQSPRNYYLYARKTFDLSARPESATIKSSADSRYKLFINGQYIGKGPVRSGGDFTYYDTYDITEYLNKGKNVIAFLVHFFGEDTSYYVTGRPGLICKADIVIDGERQTLVTDDTWKVRKAEDWTDLGDRMSESLGFQECYDSGNRMDGWNQVKFRESGWENAVAVGMPPDGPWGRLIERRIPQLREEKKLPEAIIGLHNSPDRSKDIPVSELPELISNTELSKLTAGKIKNHEALLTEDGETQIKTPRGDRGVAIILDFGCEVFGNVEVGIAGSGSGIIDLGYSEVLEDDRVRPDRDSVKYVDRITLKKGKLHWQGFEPRAFRYMQIEFRRCSKTVDIEYIRVNQTTYPVDLVGSFECDDALLNDIWHAAAYTAHLCMEDTYIDCPWRNRAQWWADARIESRTAYYAFDDTALLAQGLRQFADTQDRNGAIAGMFPASDDKLVPDFALQWIFSLLDYYGFTDDADFLKDLYPNLRKLMSFFARFANEDGLLESIPGWPFIDSADIERIGITTALNCLYYQALRVASVVAAVVGNEEDSEAYNDTACRLKLLINKYMFVPTRGLYADRIVDGKLVDEFSRQANIFAALFDVADQYQKLTIIRQTTNDNELPEIITPYFTSYLLELLYSADKHHDALNLMRKKWGELVKQGETTLGEYFGVDGSRCHGWSSGPARDLIAEIVGIKPVLGAYRFSVTPHTGGLKWARGSVRTKTGNLTVGWAATPRAFIIDVEVPEGLKVDVYPPFPENSKISVNGKAYASRLVTLSEGKHQVKVSAVRPSKSKLIDVSIKPVVIQTVELLEEMTPKMRRSLGLTVTRRERLRPGRGGSRKKSTEIEPLDIDLGAEVAADALSSPELMVPVEEGETLAAIAETTGKPKRRRSRKSRGRAGSKEAETEVAIGAVEAVVGETEITEPGAAPEIEVSPETTAKKPSRRRSRRGRGRSGAKAAVEEVVLEPREGDESNVAPAPELTDAKPAEGEVEIVQVEEGAVEEQVKRSSRRRSRRGGRRRPNSSKAAEQEATVEENAEASATEIPSQRVEIHAEPLESAIPGEEIPKKSSRRRPYRSAKRRSAKSEPAEQAGESTVEHTAASEVQIESQPVSPAVEAPAVTDVSESSEEAPKKKRTHRGGRRRSASKKPSESEGEVQAVETAPVIEAEPAPPQTETPTEAPKKKRTYTRRPRKSAKAETSEAAPEQGD